MGSHQAIAFLLDYDNAVTRAATFDTELGTKASAISQNYSDLLCITARQALAGTELTIGSYNGQWATSDIKMFMKDVGTSGYVLPSWHSDTVTMIANSLR